MNKLDEAKQGLDEAQASQIGSSLLPVGRYKLAFLKGDQAALGSLVNSTVGPSRGGLLCLQSYTEMYYGRVNKARGLLQEVVNLARQDNHPDSAADCVQANGLQEVEVENAAQAQQQAAAALALSNGRDSHASAALILARAGDVARAQALADELSQQYPQDTMLQNYSLPTIRAAIELQKKNPAKAIDILTAAVPYEMGFASFEYLYPAYVRGDAYLKLGQSQQAATEFQKMLDHPGIMENSVLGPLARLQLGRAQAMMGDKEAARKSYDDFFASWKDADPGVPVLQQARAEYAALDRP
jgi:tetratricopeptide (TPR) repeat protein